MFGQDWYRGNKTPATRLRWAEENVREARAALKRAEEKLAQAVAEMAAYDEFHRYV
jgi:hypothetical protein